MGINGYDVEVLEGPYHVSRGEWTLTGNESCQAYDLLKRTDTIVSGLWGVSGIYYTRNYAQYYDDISGISGCIGCSLTDLLADSATGMDNINRNMFRRQITVCHFGVVKLPYVSGLLDKSVVLLKWGDALAPCISGFRAYQEINVDGVTGLTTGIRQCNFATYMDTPTDITGLTGAARRKVFIHPQTLYGVHK